jgi:hypothetical protein
MSAAPIGQSQMPDITYKLVPIIPDNAGEGYEPKKFEITRTDKDSTTTVARYEKETEVVEFANKELTKFRVPVLRFLNDENVPYKTIAIAGQKRDKIKDDEPPCPIPGPAKQGTASYDAYVAYLRDGDKYAPIVEWFKKYRPEEYKLRYGIVGPGEVQKFDGFDTNQKTGEKTPRYRTQEAIIAERKTHLTEKTESNDQPSTFRV